METVIKYVNILAEIYKYLSFNDQKIISKLSIDCWNSTNQTLENKCKLSVIESSHRIRRNYDEIILKFINFDINCTAIQSIPQNIRSLKIQSNSLSHDFFIFLKKFKNLKELIIIVDVIETSESIDDYNLGLESLGISTKTLNFIEGIVSKNRNSLRKLHLSKLQLNNDFYEKFYLPSLDEITLSEVKIKCFSVPESILNQKHFLKTCNLDGTNVNDYQILLLKVYCPILETMSLNKCPNLTEQSIEIIAEMKSLKNLDIFDNPINLRTLQVLEGKNFQRLRIYISCFMQETVRIKDVLKNMTDLSTFGIKIKVLRYGYFAIANLQTNFTHDFLKFLSENCLKLKDVEIDFLNLYFDEFQTTENLKIKSLERLKSKYFFNENIKSLNAPKLRIMDLRNSQITELGICFLVKQNPFLEYLDLSDSTYLDDKCVELCIFWLHNLDEFKINFCRQVSMSSFTKILFNTRIRRVEMIGILSEFDPRIDDIVISTDNFSRLRGNEITNGTRIILI